MLKLNLSGIQKATLMSSLETLGLNKNEILIYIALIKNPEAHAIEISRRTGIHRSNIYDSLRNLINKGFVSEMITDKKKFFVPLDPGKLSGFMEAKGKELESSIDILKKIRNKGSLEEGVFFIKGSIALREEVFSLLEREKELLINGADKEMVNFLTEEFLKVMKKKAYDENIQIKIIQSCNTSNCKKIKSLGKFETRKIKDFFKGNAFEIITSDSLLYITHNSPLECIKIKNKEIASYNKTKFENLWENAAKDE